MKKKVFKITLEVTEGLCADRMADHIKDSVKAMDSKIYKAEINLEIEEPNTLVKLMNGKK